MDRIIDSLEDSQGFILSSVFQKKYSLDVNLKRHEDMKNWMTSKDLKFIVLDGVQKVVDKEEEKVYDYSILYTLTFFNSEQMEGMEFYSLAQILIKRYDLHNIILKNPSSKELESWNRDFQKKTFRNITSNNMAALIESFFKGLNKKKDKFYFLGIERPEILSKGPLFRPIIRKESNRAIA
ncbi:MAG: hypothetical protein JJT78_11500 [Leptospira sp.]|nr:hypothetical protein [Leptospira sp.]